MITVTCVYHSKHTTGTTVVSVYTFGREERGGERGRGKMGIEGRAYDQTRKYPVPKQ